MPSLESQIINYQSNNVLSHANKEMLGTDEYKMRLLHVWLDSECFFCVVKYSFTNKKAPIVQVNAGASSFR
jgi:hypothetical protein